MVLVDPGWTAPGRLGDVSHGPGGQQLVVGEPGGPVGDGRGIPGNGDAGGLAVIAAGFGAAQGVAAGGDAEDLGDGCGRGGLPGSHGSDRATRRGRDAGGGGVGRAPVRGGDAGGGARGDEGVAAGAGHGDSPGFHGADDLGGGLHGDVPAGHHRPLGWQPVTLAKFAGGDLGTQLPDDLHVQRYRPVQLGGPVTHLPSVRRTASLFSILSLDGSAPGTEASHPI